MWPSAVVPPTPSALPVFPNDPFAAVLFALWAVLLAAILLLANKRAPSKRAGPPTSVDGAGSELGAYEYYTSNPCDGDESYEPPTSYVVFIPGNPGVPGFYAEFADRLCESLGASVIVMGLAGHLSLSARSQLPPSEQRRLFSLEDQLRHVVARASGIQAQAAAAGVPFTLVGHSIGAWLALRAAQQLQPAPRTIRSSPGAAVTTSSAPSARQRAQRSPSRTRPAAAAGAAAAAAAAATPSPSAHVDSSFPAPRALLITPFLETPSSPALISKRMLFYSPLFGGLFGGSGGVGGGGGANGGGEASRGQSGSMKAGGSKMFSTINSSEAFIISGGIPAHRPRSFAALALEPLCWLCSVAFALPERWLRLLLWAELRALAPEHADYVVHELSHRHCLRNILYLGYTEFALLEHEFDLEEMSPLCEADRVRCLYVPDDQWAPLSVCARLNEQLGVVADVLQSTDDVEMRHAFSVQPASCARVAEWAAKSIAQMVGLRSWR